MEYEKLIEKRQSTRLFQDKQISEEELEKILEAGRLAPTARNRQWFKIYVIQENIEKVDKASPCRYNAPTCLMVCGYSKQEAYNANIPVDSSIVTTHMMLEATNIGVDNLWVGYFDPEIIKKEFNVPKELKPIALLMLGYEDKNAPENKIHNKRKDISELIERV